MLNLIQNALNRYIALDPESHRHLEKLQGHIVQIELTSLDFIFQLAFTQTKIELLSDLKLKSDITIKGSPLSLLRMTLSKDRKKFFSEEVSIQGNLELGQEVIALFDQLEIDWEEHLAKKIGDVPAHQLGRFSRGLKKWVNHAKEALTQDLNEYLHEEKTWFPQREILQEFFDEVDELRMDVDRLAAKIKNLTDTGFFDGEES